MGVDLAEYVKPVDNGIEVHAILSPEESQALRDKGFDVQEAVSDQSDYAENMTERAAQIRAVQAPAASTDTLTVLRSEWFRSLGDIPRYGDLAGSHRAGDRRALLGGRQQRRRALVQPGHHRLGLRGRRGRLQPDDQPVQRGRFPALVRGGACGGDGVRQR
jgi:hypothetical protein